MKQSHIFVTDDFSRTANDLRKVFDNKFANPHKAHEDRFVWDYWHIPNQYTVLRTPAYHFFTDKIYQRFHHELVMWGRRNLGCWDTSPTWLSCYVDGCKQDFHSDIPHGPWAWVFSLTPKKVKFSGGETFILKPEVLNYWQNFNKTSNRELHSFLDFIPSRFNRLTVFDPRYPHGVSEVRGTHDPRFGRLVIHGWFTEPKTYIEGPLPAKKTEIQLNKAFDQLMNLVEQAPPTQGVVSLRLDVSTTGSVTTCEFKTNTLVHINGEKTTWLNKEILKIYSRLEFSNAKGKSSITIPLVFS